MSRKGHRALWMAAILLFGGLLGCSRDRSVEAAQEGRPPSVSPAAQDFMMKTAEADLSDIEMARLALQKSGNPGVRDFANMVQNDSSAALEDLTDLMKDKYVPQPRAVSSESQQDLRRMMGLAGPEFDREFMNMMVADHQKAIEMFHDQISIAQDPDVKKYAEDRLPKLETHLEKGQRLQSKLFNRRGP